MQQSDLFGDGAPRVPFAKGSDTSKAAAASMAASAQGIAARVLAHIAAKGGATCFEIEKALKLSHQTASARITHLRQGGKIRDSGARRKTETGRNAVVWEIDHA